MSTDALLAWINARLDRISAEQHQLARQKALLREQATRLRLGVSAADVEHVLKGELRAACTYRRRTTTVTQASAYDARTEAH